MASTWCRTHERQSAEKGGVCRRCCEKHSGMSKIVASSWVRVAGRHQRGGRGAGRAAGSTGDKRSDVSGSRDGEGSRGGRENGGHRARGDSQLHGGHDHAFQGEGARGTGWLAARGQNPVSPASHGHRKLDRGHLKEHQRSDMGQASRLSGGRLTVDPSKARRQRRDARPNTTASAAGLSVHQRTGAGGETERFSGTSTGHHLLLHPMPDPGFLSAAFQELRGGLAEARARCRAAPPTGTSCR